MKWIEPTAEEVRKLINESPKLIPKNLVIDELNWRLVVRGLLRSENILILGYSGCGKTLTAKSIATAYDRPFEKFNMGATQDARSSLIGNTHFKPESGTFFVGSKFIKAVTTPGTFIYLDEITRMSVDAENIMMTVLDRDQRYVRIDEDQDSPVIKVASGVVFIATANVGPEYTATRLLDRATKDRFSTIIELDLLEEAQEIALAKLLFPELNRNYINAIASIAKYTRDDIKSASPQLSTILSTRSIHESCRLAMDGFRFSEIMEACVFNLFDDSGVDGERAKVRQKANEKATLDNESPLISEAKVIPSAETQNSVKKKDWFDVNTDVM
jgi:MoxR-like ATPase